MQQPLIDTGTTPGRGRGTAWRAGVLAAIVMVGLAACGGESGEDSGDEGGLSADATHGTVAGEPRTVEVRMVDNEFTPDQVNVATGETVRFGFANEGQVAHDAVIGDEAAQAAHEDEMRTADDSEMGGAMDHGTSGADESEDAVTVQPGETGDLTHTFAAGDQLLIGCHEPGHYVAGMKLAIQVADA